MLFGDIGDGQTDGQTDEQTFVLLESLSRLKMAIFWKLSPNKKNVTAQKSSKMYFYIILGGPENFSNFSKKIFFGTPFRNFFLQSLKIHILIPILDYYCF